MVIVADMRNMRSMVMRLYWRERYWYLATRSSLLLDSLPLGHRTRYVNIARRTAGRLLDVTMTMSLLIDWLHLNLVLLRTSLYGQIHVDDSCNECKVGNDHIISASCGSSILKESFHSCHEPHPEG